MSPRVLIIPEMRHLRVLVKPEQGMIRSTSDSVAVVGGLKHFDHNKVNIRAASEIFTNSI